MTDPIADVRVLAGARVADHLAIQDLATSYAHAVDDRDWQRWEALFFPDAFIDFTSAGGIAGTPAELLVDPDAKPLRSGRRPDHVELLNSCEAMPRAKARDVLTCDAGRRQRDPAPTTEDGKEVARYDDPGERQRHVLPSDVRGTRCLERRSRELASFFNQGATRGIA